MAVYQPNVSLLATQVTSIQRQTITDWNCVIGIDGSDADTRDVLLDLTSDDERFTVHEFPERVGFYRNFERVLHLVGDDVHWVALADQDDAWHVDKLEVLLDSLGSASMVLGQARLIRRDMDSGEAQELGITDRCFVSTSELMLDNVVSGALSLFRADVLDLALPFPPKTDVAYHDHWLGLCAALKLGIVAVPDVVQDYVQHDRNVIGEELAASGVARLRTLLNRSESFGKALTYLVNHRWRWRVHMAKLALDRSPQLEGQELLVLRSYAADRASFNLFRLATVSVIRGRSSRFRVLALFCASIFAPFINEETTDEA